MVEFQDLVGVAIAAVSKKLDVKYVTLRAVGSREGGVPPFLADYFTLSQPEE